MLPSVLVVVLVCIFQLMFLLKNILNAPHVPKQIVPNNPIPHNNLGSLLSIKYHNLIVITSLSHLEILQWISAYAHKIFFFFFISNADHLVVFHQQYLQTNELVCPHQKKILHLLIYKQETFILTL